MHIAISAPIKKEFEETVSQTFPDSTFPASWKLPIKAHNIYESAQSNRSLYILSILCIPCQLAHALTQGSERLALDEPTNHLDIKYQLQMESTI